MIVFICCLPTLRNFKIKSPNSKKLKTEKKQLTPNLIDALLNGFRFSQKGQTQTDLRARRKGQTKKIGLPLVQ